MDQSSIQAVLDNIASRRSVGLAKIKPDPVDPKIIAKALEAANWAPSHRDTEPWRFSVFTGDSRLKLSRAFAEAYKIESGESFKQETYDSNLERANWAPLWISIGMTPAFREDGSPVVPIDEEIMAVACAVQNLHLAFAAHGLVGMWHSKNVSIHPHTANFLGLTPPSQLLGFFFCGYPSVQWPEGERGPWQNKVAFYF
ncbi:MAG: nitroreductase [Fimbriimonadaceae bacterium]